MAVAATAAMTLVGCGSPSASYCEAIDESELGIHAFAPVTVGTDQVAWATLLLETLDAAGDPPAEVEADHATWVDYLEDVQTTGDGSAHDLYTDEVQDAAHTLADHYSTVCVDGDTWS